MRTASSRAMLRCSVPKVTEDTLVEGSTSIALLRAKSENLVRLSTKCISSHLESTLSCKESVFQIKQKSHEELDIEIQSARILYVLDELIDKLEIAAYIPVLMEGDGELLYQHLPIKDADFIVEACIPYIDVPEEPEEKALEGVSLYSGSMVGYRPSTQPPTLTESKIEENIKFVVKTAKPDGNLQQAIAMIYGSQKLKNILLGMTDVEPDPTSSLLIDGAKRLRAVAAQKLAISANEERERERELRKAWKENAEARLLIGSIQEKLDKQKEELDVELNAKDELINSYTDKIEALKAKFKEDIKKRINDSEKTMIQRSQVSEEIQARLQQESKEVTHSYWTLLDVHLASEKVLRAKRYKIEAQLASWLAKYDQDVGERQSELEELQRLYDEEMDELNALQRKFDEQDEEYTELMAEKEEYERQIYEEKAYIFLSNRAARLIQRYWKAYRERKRLRKKRKAKKKEKGSASGDSGDNSAKKKSASDKGKGKKGKKAKKGKEDKDILTSTEDPMKKLSAKFKSGILEDINAEPIPTRVSVDL